MKTRNVILALASAATVGVAIGILIAPEKGSELRKKLTNHAGNFASELGDLINKGITQFAEMKGDVANQVAGLEVSRKDRSATNMI